VPYRMKNLSGLTCPSILFLGEGDAECELIAQILGGCDADDNDVGVMCIEGINKIMEKARLISKEVNFPEVNKIGIMIDANNDRNSRLDQACGALRIVKYPHQRDTLRGTDLCVSKGKTSSIYLSPYPTEHGTIEKLIRDEIDTSELSGCLVEFDECVLGARGEHLSDKAFVQAFISANGGPCGIHRGFEIGILDFNAPAYQPVRHLHINR